MNCTTTFTIDSVNNRRINFVAIDQAATDATYDVTATADTTVGSEQGTATNVTFNGTNPRSFSITFNNPVNRLTGIDYTDGGGGSLSAVTPPKGHEHCHALLRLILASRRSCCCCCCCHHHDSKQAEAAPATGGTKKKAKRRRR